MTGRGGRQECPGSGRASAQRPERAAHKSSRASPAWRPRGLRRRAGGRWGAGTGPWHPRRLGCGRCPWTQSGPRCAAALARRDWQPGAIRAWACHGGRANPRWQRPAAGAQPSQRERWSALACNWKTEWPWGCPGDVFLLRLWRYREALCLMVGGLVTGALEKLYHQPSLGAWPRLLRARARPLQCKQLTQPCSPPPLARA